MPAKDKPTSITIIILISTIFVFGSWVFTFFPLNDLSFQNRGTFGDMFGGLNALFSGLAFAGIIYTILLQREELKLQRKELKETRAVLKEQGDTINLQRFENSFYNLLELRRKVFENISSPDGKGHIVFGTIAYRNIWREFKDDINSRNEKDIKEIRRALENFINLNHANSLHPYFSTNFHILEFLEKTNIINKKSYIDLYVAQLTELDKLFLFYLGAFTNPGNTLKPLLEKFSVLRYLNYNRLLDHGHAYIYDGKAFNPDK